MLLTKLSLKGKILKLIVITNISNCILYTYGKNRIDVVVKTVSLKYSNSFEVFF